MTKPRLATLIVIAFMLTIYIAAIISYEQKWIY